MTKDLQKMILRAYKSLDNELGVNLSKNAYYTLAIYALEFFTSEWEGFVSGYDEETFYINEEGRINYTAFFHTLFLNDAFIYDYKGKKQGFYGKYYFVEKHGLLEFDY